MSRVERRERLSHIEVRGEDLIIVKVKEVVEIADDGTEDVLRSETWRGPLYVLPKEEQADLLARGEELIDAARSKAGL